MTEAEALARNARANERPEDKELITRTRHDASNRPIIEHSFDPPGSGSKMRAWMSAYASPTYLQICLSKDVKWNAARARAWHDERQGKK